MTSIDMFHRAHATRGGRNIAAAVIGFAVSAASGIFRALQRRHKQRRDRAAFMTLLDKEAWVYRDMGIHRGDVEWAARLPLHVNAAKELERIRAESRQGR